MNVVITAEQMGMTREAWAAQRARAQEIKPGDLLHMDPMWNRSTHTAKVGDVCYVTDVQAARSQTGVMVTVRGWDGPVTVDAGWFLEVQRAGGRE